MASAWYATGHGEVNWAAQPATGSRVGQPEGAETGSGPNSASGSNFPGSKIPPALPASHEDQPSRISIGKIRLAPEGAGASTDVFTLSLGDETIQLLPFRNWGQLDIFKWRVRGKLPGTPPGLDVTLEHVKVGGQIVLASDPDACAKLEAALNNWLVAEKSNQQAVLKKAHTKPATGTSEPSQMTEKLPFSLRFRVELDKRGQVHVICARGAEILSSIGLTLPGFNGLFSQGLMRKPRTLEVGALHDWIELDGELCSFEHGNNDSLKLEKILNEHYIVPSSLSTGKDIVVFANPASPTGFDIQFPVTVGGVQEARRRPLNDAALELLQDPIRCALLQPGLILKIIPPTFVFKRKTPDGGEAYLDKSAANLVAISGPDSGGRFVDLSQPVNYTRLGVLELTAVFNHPSLNRHASTALVSSGAKDVIEQSPVQRAPLEMGAVPGPVTQAPVPQGVADPDAAKPAADKLVSRSVAPPKPEINVSQAGAPKAARSHSRPNAWLDAILGLPSIRYDWFSCLIYSRFAAYFSNSQEGAFGAGKCWFVALGEVADLSQPGFKGVFFTEKGGLGFRGGGRLARFHRGVVFVGTLESVLEGIGTDLVAVGLDAHERVVFIVADDYLSRFGVPSHVAAQECARLASAGAVLAGVRETLQSEEALEVVWTVPAAQQDPANPEACEHHRPGSDK